MSICSQISSNCSQIIHKFQGKTNSQLRGPRPRQGAAAKGAAAPVPGPRDGQPAVDVQLGGSGGGWSVLGRGGIRPA